MWWLKISCPICPCDKRGEPKYWNHTNCNKDYSTDNDLKIDINGNIFCNGCHKKYPIIDFGFSCERHNSEKITNFAYLLEVLQVMINMSKNISEQIKFAQLVANISKMFSNK